MVEAREDRGDLAGTVLDASSGAPVPKFFVAVTDIESPSEPHPRHGDVIVEEGKNTFQIRAISPGAATVYFSAPGYASTETHVNVESGKSGAVSALLSPEGAIEGTVTLNGAPCSGRVSMRLADRRPMLEPWGGNPSFPAPARGADADAEGTFTVRGLSSGDYLVRADALAASGPPSLILHGWSKASVVAGRVTRVDLGLEGAATLRGNFTFPDGYKYTWLRVYEGALSTRLPLEDEFREWGLIRATADFAGKSGPFEVPNLAPGTYTVVGLCSGAANDAPPDARELQPAQVSRVIKIGDDGVELDLEIEPPP
jgi:hypothetical protein